MASKRIGSSLAARIKQLDQQVKQGAINGLRDIGADWRRYYLLVVAQWKGKPRFDLRIATLQDRIQLYVMPAGEFAQRWIWVDQGTEAHIIRPKLPGGKLKFQAGYSAKTKAVAQYNVGSGKSSGQWVSTQIVHHPGTEAREFGKAAARRVMPTIKPVLIKAIRQAVTE